MLWNLESPYDSFIPKWSQARQDSWDLCERLFFYRYRATSGESRHPARDKIAALKKRKPIQVAKGEIIHHAIAGLLGSNPSGNKMNINDALGYVWQKELSNPENRLIEFVNGRGLTTTLLDQYRQECLRLLESYTAIWKQFSGEEIVYIENHEAYPGWFLCGNIAVYARPDIILKRDKYLILDWKTGAEPDDYADNILEMSTSIYLACYDFDGRSRASLDEIEGAFVYLPSEKVSPLIQRTQKDYDKFSQLIEEKVNAFHVSLVEEHYTPDPAKWKCRACNFATICRDGKLLLE
jgi:hypothetical protein